MRASISSANNSAVACSDCTNTTEPIVSAMACRVKLATAARLPSHHRA